jgi:hypothetical protein
MDYIESLGHEITHDWTCQDTGEVDETDDMVFVYGEWISKSDLREQALDDVTGVKEADCVVVYAVNAHRYAGTCTEIGIAIGKGIPVYIVGHNLGNNIFVYHPLVQVFEELEDLPL